MKWSEFYIWLQEQNCSITKYGDVYYNTDYLINVDTLEDSDSGEIEESIIIIKDYIRNIKIRDLLD